MFKGLNGLNPGNEAFKQFKCPILNVLMSIAAPLCQSLTSHQSQHCIQQDTKESNINTLALIIYL